MSKFSVGEIAEYLGTPPDQMRGHGQNIMPGEMVRIIGIGPFPTMDGPADYDAELLNGSGFVFCDEKDLRKRPDPSIERFRKTLIPYDKSMPTYWTWKEPLEETVKRTLTNMENFSGS